MRYVLKLVGVILVFVLGVLPSVALAGACTVVRSSHPCCPAKSIPQSRVASFPLIDGLPHLSLRSKPELYIPIDRSQLL